MSKLKMLVAAAALTVMGSPAIAMDGNVEEGAKVFKKCATCHIVEEAKNKVGPQLIGIVGRKIAVVEGFKYSTAMIEFGAGDKVWDEALLGEYLANPKGVVKGTKMAFAGLKKEEEIANVIAYLKTFPAQ
ncbi:MAG: cytochrome c family protein [Ahrensia sp.]|nr:cytochrome c family protein [Ahrensia sp.]